MKQAKPIVASSFCEKSYKPQEVLLLIGHLIHTEDCRSMIGALIHVRSNHKQATSSWPELALQHILIEILEVLFQKEGNCYKGSNNNNWLRKSFIVLYLFFSPLKNAPLQNVQYATAQL